MQIYSFCQNDYLDHKTQSTKSHNKARPQSATSSNNSKANRKATVNMIEKDRTSSGSSVVSDDLQQDDGDGNIYN
jgi:hypothetical protein